MGMLTFLPFLFVLIYLAILFGILFLIYTWVTKFIFLKKEHNDLLREIIKRMDNKQV